MISTCETYAMNHNLQFSTNIDPKKSKTKCMAFLKSERQLNKIKLNGNYLPFVTSAKHLGNTIVVASLQKILKLNGQDIYKEITKSTKNSILQIPVQNAY